MGQEEYLFSVLVVWLLSVVKDSSTGVKEVLHGKFSSKHPVRSVFEGGDWAEQSFRLPELGHPYILRQDGVEDHRTYPLVNFISQKIAKSCF